MKFILFISKKQSVYHLFAKYPDNTSIFHKDYPVHNLLNLQIARNGLCGAFWIGVFVLLKTTKIGCWRFVAAKGADLRSVCGLIVFTLAVGEICLVPVYVFLDRDFAVGTVVALGEGCVFPFFKVRLLDLIDLHSR